MRNLRAALLLTIVLPAVAAERPNARQPGLEPPPPPAYLDPALVRQVTIIKRGTDTVEEYRAGAKLFMLKVAPADGVPYFLIDEKGDGTMTRRVAP